MINHIRTLLINLPQGASSMYSSIYTPPDFGAVTVPSGLAPFDRLIFAGGDPVERVTLVDALLPLLHAGELDPIMRRLDPRVTYAYRTRSTTADTTQQGSNTVGVAGLYTRVLSSSIPSAAAVLFAPTHPAVPALQSMWVHADEGAVRVSALCVAYAYQLEFARTGGL